MLLRTILVASLISQTAIPVSAADSRYFYRDTRTGVLDISPGDDTPEPTQGPFIDAPGKTVLGTTSSNVNWNPGTVIDKVTGGPYKGTVAFTANYDLALYGLSLDHETGAISGTPTRPFIVPDFQLTLSADGKSNTTRPFWLGVAPSQKLGVAQAQRSLYATRLGAEVTTDAIVLENAIGTLSFSTPENLGNDVWNYQTGSLRFDAASIGSRNFTTTATDEFGRSLSFTFAVDVKGSMQIAEISPLKAYGYEVYSSETPLVTPFATNMLGNASWSASNLPVGLSIDQATGAISGTLNDGAAQGVQDIVVSVTDQYDNATASKKLSLDVGSPMIAPYYFGRQMKIDVDGDGGAYNIRDRGNAGYKNHTLTWTMTDGSLPPGVIGKVVGADMVFAGTPTQLGDFKSTWKVKDENGWELGFAPITLSVVNRDPLAIAAMSDVVIRGDAVYSGSNPVTTAALTPSPVGTVSWSADNLPPGLAIDPTTGSITGSVIDGSAQGVRKIDITATDSIDGATQTSSFSLSVDSPIWYLENDPGPLQQNMAVSFGKYNLRDPGNRPYLDKGTVAEVIAGELPPGISVGTSDEFVMLVGTPTQLGTYQATVKVTDQHGWTLVLPKLTLTVRPKDAVVIGAISDRSVTGNQSFTIYAPVLKAEASNLAGTATWSAAGLPEGLSIDPATGVIFGSVTNGREIGSHDVTVKVADSGDGSSQTGTFALAVNNAMRATAFDPPQLKLGVAMASQGILIRDANTGSGYDISAISATRDGGNLPPGISARMVGDTLTFSGTPTEAGTFVGDWTVTDQNGWALKLPTVTFTVVDEPIKVNAIAKANVVGSGDYTAKPLLTASATNAVGNVTWTANGLPPGLAIDGTTGAVTGSVKNPSAAGTWNVTVSASDELNTSSANFQIEVLVPFYAANFTQPTLKTGVQSDFGINLRIPGDQIAYANRGVSTTLVSGSAVPGLTPNYVGGNIVFTGTPTTTGNYSGIYKFTDVDGWNVSVAITFNVEVREALVVGAGSMVAFGNSYYTEAAPVGGVGVTSGQLGTITWTANNLPTGLAINPSTGLVYGRPTVPSELGVRTVTFIATDSDGTSGSRDMAFNLRTQIWYRDKATDAGKKNVTYGWGMNVVDPGNAKYPFATEAHLVGGSLPPGITVAMDNNQNVVFSGKPTATGTYTATTRITDISTNGNTGWYTEFTKSFVIK